jgi:hypothetical protein
MTLYVESHHGAAPRRVTRSTITNYNKVVFNMDPVMSRRIGIRKMLRCCRQYRYKHYDDADDCLLAIVRIYDGDELHHT